MAVNTALGLTTRQAFALGGGLTVAAAGILMAPALVGRDVLPPCVFRSLTGLDCPFCGGTRATRALLTGDLGGAFDHNALVPLAALLLIGVGIWWLVARSTKVDFAPVRRVFAAKAFWFGLLAVLLVFWVVRNLPQFASLASPA